MGDDTADNSVGNVTGSNCVNVFLGLGLPWMIGSLWWPNAGPNAEWLRRYGPGTQFEGLIPAGEAAFIVPAGTLVFSVIIFCICALVALFVLQIRRVLYGGELGGPRGPRIATSALFVCLWLLYVLLSIL